MRAEDFKLSPLCGLNITSHWGNIESFNVWSPTPAGREYSLSSVRSVRVSVRRLSWLKPSFITSRCECFSSAVPHLVSPCYITWISSFLHPACYCLQSKWTQVATSAMCFQQFRLYGNTTFPYAPHVFAISLPGFGRLGHSLFGICLGKTPCVQARPSAELITSGWGRTTAKNFSQKNNSCSAVHGVCVRVCFLICSTRKYCDIKHVTNYLHIKARMKMFLICLLLNVHSMSGRWENQDLLDVFHPGETSVSCGSQVPLLEWLHVLFWTVGGSSQTWREPMQTSTPKLHPAA